MGEEDKATDTVVEDKSTDTVVVDNDDAAEEYIRSGDGESTIDDDVPVKTEHDDRDRSDPLDFEEPAPYGDHEDDDDGMTRDEPSASDKDEPADEDDSSGADEDAGDTISAELRDRAKAAGLTDEDVEVFGNEAALNRALDLQLGKQLEDRAAGKEPESTKPPEPKPEPESKTKPDASGEEKFDVSVFDQDDFDPDLAKAIKGSHSHLDNKLQQLGSIVEKIAGAMKAERHQQNANWMDGKLKDLGPEWEDTFGKGSYRELSTDSTTYKNRVQVAQAIEVIAQGYLAKGLNVPTRDKLFEWAVNSRFANKVKGHIRKGVSKRTQERRRKSSTRPTNRESSLPLGEERATRNLGRLMRQKGIDTEG